MREWLKRLFSDANGIPDEARVAAFLLVLTFIGGTITSVVFSSTHYFDMQQFGIGAAGLAAGIGAWFGIRKDN